MKAPGTDLDLTLIGADAEKGSSIYAAAQTISAGVKLSRQRSGSCSGLVIGTSGINSPIYSDRRSREQQHDEGVIKFADTVARKSELKEEQPIQFNVAHAAIIFAGVIPILFGGAWSVLGITTTDAWSMFPVLPISVVLYWGAFFFYLRSDKGKDGVVQSWPRTVESRGNFFSTVCEFGARGLLHNGIYSWLVMWSLLMLSIMLNVAYLRGSSICSPYTRFVVLDDNFTRIRLDSCNWELWTRDFTAAQYKEYIAEGWNEAWTMVYPDLVALNERDNTTYTWIPSGSVVAHTQHYYVFLQGQNAACTFILLVFVLALSSLEVTPARDKYLGELKAKLELEEADVITEWQDLETDAEVFARAGMYGAFNAGMKVGFTIGTLSGLYILASTPAYTVSFVCLIFLASVVFSCSWMVVHATVYSRSAYVLARLQMRAVFLSQMIGGKSKRIKSRESESGVTVKSWFKLRRFLLDEAMPTEFGVVSVVITGQLLSAVFITLFCAILVLPQKDVSKIVLGTKFFIGFALLCWAYVMPLILACLSINLELDTHVRLLNLNDSPEASRTCALIKEYPSYVKLLGLPITMGFVNVVKGYAITAGLSLFMKFVLPALKKSLK